MKTFPGWREVGRAMRWSRQQDGVQRSTIAERGCLAEARWSDLDADLTVLPRGLMRVSVVADGAVVTLRRPSATRVLGVLAALDLIPAELAEVTS